MIRMKKSIKKKRAELFELEQQTALKDSEHSITNSCLKVAYCHTDRGRTLHSPVCPQLCGNLSESLADSSADDLQSQENWEGENGWVTGRRKPFRVTVQAWAPNISHCERLLSIWMSTYGFDGQISVGDKDLFVQAGTFTASQMLPGGT